MNRALRVRIVQEYGTQSDFCMATGEDEALVSRVIRGRRSLSSERKKEWARVLDCRIEDLFEDGDGVNGKEK